MTTQVQISKQKIFCFVATFYLVLMNQQYYLLEGDLVSPVKVAAMCATPIIWFFMVPNFSKALAWGIIYLTWLFMVMYLRFDAPRLETLGYSAMFFCTYMVFYGLVYAGAFTKEYFQKLMRFLLWAYIIVLIAQQAASVLEIIVPEINLAYDVGEFRLKVPSLSLEPSHSARIMAFMFYAFLKVTELINGVPVTLKDLFIRYRKLTLFFLYAMISMYSGTAILMLVLLSFYFFQRKHMFYIIPFFIAIWVYISDVDYNPVQRTFNTAESVLTLDTEEVIKTDDSAAARITPIMNAFKMDFSDMKTWLGHGTDTFASYEHLSEQQTIWTDRGVICYLLGVAVIFACAIRPFLSLPTLMALCAFGWQVVNIYYIWGALMILTCVTYFRENNNDKVSLEVSLIKR